MYEVRTLGDGEHLGDSEIAQQVKRVAAEPRNWGPRNRWREST